MSDAFADLWSSTGVSKPADPPRKLGALATAAPAPAAQRRPQNDVFSVLAAAGSSPSLNARTPTPSQPASASFGGSPPVRSTAAQKANGLGGGDVFSGLLSGSLSSGPASNAASLTIAQRAALAEQERQARAAPSASSAHTAPPSSTWAGLSALGNSSSSKPAVAAHGPLAGLGFDSFSSAPPASQPPRADDDWLSELSAKPVATSKPSTITSVSQNLLDWDEFESSSSTKGTSQNDTLGDFDFGDREDGDGLLGSHGADEDDILGDLAKPVEQLHARRPQRNTPSPQPPRNRAVSPPPHLLGQIVEMGFSVQQARVALAATDTGLDVQAAIENLLANGAASSPAPEQQEERRRRPQREPGHERYYDSDEDDSARRPSARPRQQQQQPPARRPARERENAERNGASSVSEGQRNLQEQADKLIAQASEIGLTMFTRANAFWKEGKERVQRAYEERAAAAASAGAGASRQGPVDDPRSKGRPKWMQDVPEDEHLPQGAKGGAYVDFDDEEPAPAQRRQPPLRAQEPVAAESPASRFKTGNLLADDAPSVYVSPFRRKTPSRTQSAATTPTPAAAQSRPTPPRAPSPIALARRTCVSASATAISASNQQKALGTEKFKLGQYGEAEAFYTAAVAALPENHLLLVPLLNNRALTRLKTGDASGAIADCTAVIALIGEGYHPAREAKVTREDEGAGVDLADALVKAHKRRAEAYEGKEKWEQARADWEVVAGAEFAGRARTEGVTGIGRCRRMINAETGAPPPPPPQTRPTAARQAAKPKARGSTPPSEALDRVQAQNRAAEAEDQQKHELKDVVDAKLGAWKAGKENNIRALIASLDTVLWPELGWQKVGIHELVSPGQVKVRYTKAIAKLHPDKLNVKNTTLEQRMVANGVFGTLNEAWNAFKP